MEHCCIVYGCPNEPTTSKTAENEYFIHTAWLCSEHLSLIEDLDQNVRLEPSCIEVVLKPPTRAVRG